MMKVDSVIIIYLLKIIMELKQTFESITPVYTWDAWMEGGEMDSW